MDMLDLRRRLPVLEPKLDKRPITQSLAEEHLDHYSVVVNFEKSPTEQEYVDKYKEGSTRRLRGYWEVHFITDYQMDDIGGPGLQGCTWTQSNNFKLYGRGSLERDSDKAVPVMDHELEHQLDPYAPEEEIRRRTNTSSSNPHFSYTVLWSY